MDTILDEAKALIYGDRNDSYGAPEETWGMVAELWSARLREKLGDGCKISAQDAIACMVLVKLVREARKPSRDNRVDGIGYIALLQMIEDAERS